MSINFLGGEILSKLVTSGVTLPLEITISGISKLLYHLIMHAVKENCINHLLHITGPLVKILQASMKSGHDNIMKDSAGLCKQISDHLWNAAIRLTTKTMDKQQRELLALSLRENSIDLLVLVKLDVCTIIERGLQAGKQFQVEVSGSSKRKEGTAFLVSLLNKVITLVEGKLQENVQVYARLEDLCITCCKLISTPSYELVSSFNHLVKKDIKKHKERFRVFQSVVQILLTALHFRFKEEMGYKKQQYDLDLRWCAIHERLNITIKAMSGIDANLWVESQIHLAINYLRCICSKILKGTEKVSDNPMKIPSDVLSTLYDLLLACYSVQSSVVTSKVTLSQSVSSGKTWEKIVQPRLGLLYLISTVVLKRSSMSKAAQNGR